MLDWLGFRYKANIHEREQLSMLWVDHRDFFPLPLSLFLCRNKVGEGEVLPSKLSFSASWAKPGLGQPSAGPPLSFSPTIEQCRALWHLIL